MGDEHKRGDKKGKFCGIPGTPCECGNDYIKVCEPSWSFHTFRRLVRAESGTFGFEKKFEAHHVVCVSPVSSEIIAKPKIDGIIRGTTWCINNKENMLAMPLWGHSVMWYCKITVAGGKLDASSAPPFADIPQHDWDHNCRDGYTDEVVAACKDLAAEIESEGHNVEPDDIKGALDELSSDFKSKLKSRGAREGGTHKQFVEGGTSARWGHPFSMATDGKVTSKGYPVKVFDERVARWIERIKNAIMGS
ncbi:hypothetical protein [Niveibacterium sp. SC-1]|uniref:hypothetical protein n=1 Tax=Niveibacterium sp. SC-1 TaxID=3135646 RepID=UPI00311DDFAA